MEDPQVVAEKRATTSEEGGPGSDLPLVNGVARDYELKCALSELFVGCPFSHLMFHPPI